MEKNCFIAGGFFIKYIKTPCSESTQPGTSVENQNINIYVNYGDKYFSTNENELKNVMNESFAKATIATFFFQNVFATFQIDVNQMYTNSNGNLKDLLKIVKKEKISTIYVHVCTNNCEDMLNKFTFNPCKIAYKYNTKCIILSNWFLKGGKLDNSNKKTNDQSSKLKANYKNKGIETDDLYKTGIKRFISCESENDLENEL